MGKHRPKKGRAAKKAKRKNAKVDEEFNQSPHSFIFNRGKVGKNVSQLILDLRKVMEPFTASNLKVKKKNNLKDFVSVAGLYNVSHLIMLKKTDSSIYIKIACSPHGPTLTFKMLSYSLIKDVVSSIKRFHMESKQFLHHPLLVMNNFSSDHFKNKLVSTVFQNMLPSINVHKAKLNDYKRCVVLSYNQNDESLDFRHYNIHVVPAGLSKSIRKLIKPKIPDISRYTDVSEFVIKGGNLSESEAEMDGPSNEVTLPQFFSGRGNMTSAKSAIRLTEIGPRMNIQLIKIHEGLNEGKCLYNKFKEENNNNNINGLINYDKENNIDKKKNKKKVKIKEEKMEEDEEEEEEEKMEEEEEEDEEEEDCD